MSNTTSPVALKDVIYKLQLCLLEGIQSENQLLVAGSLLSKSDYNDVVTERSIVQMCGYPLCRNSLALSEPAKKGRYSISLKEHKVYDLLETRMYCSTKCLVDSRAYAGSLEDERSLEFDSGKVDKVMRMFELKGEEGGEGDFGLSTLSIKEKDDQGAGVGIVSMEEWIGPSNAVEGYVPRASKNRPGSKVKDGKLRRDEKEEGLLDELNFTSSIITQGDGYSISKKPSGQPKVNKKHTQSNNEEERKVGEPSGDGVDQPSGSGGLKSCLKTTDGSKVKDSKLKRDERKEEGMFDELNFMSSIITQGDGYSISEKPSGQTKMNKKHTRFNNDEERKVGEPSGDGVDQPSGSGGLKSCLKSTDGSKVKDGKLKRDKTKEEGMFDELNFMSSIITQGDGYSISKKPSGQTKMSKKHTQFNVKEESKVVEPRGDGDDQPSSSIGLKSCLKSKPCSVGRNVTWADDDKQVSENEKEKDKGFGILEDQLAAAEVGAQAETQHVASGDVPVSDAGMLPGAVIPEPAQLKWPKKTGIVESDFFDNDSWFDTTPEEFVVNLSPFATMFMSMFAWVSSSTLAYVYGGEDSFDYASVNGREYPQKIVLTDGRSSEIKQTLASCLARALPGLVLHLRIATPVSTIEYGMGCLLETMSFLDPLPALRMKQWHVILLLFLEALSVSRIPALAPRLTTSFLHKVFEDGPISREEYEVLKDLILPLGRFGMQSGA